MKKAFLIVIAVILLIVTTTATSCSSGISKEQYDALYVEASALRAKKTEASYYATFLDILMYQFYKQANVPTRYQFTSYDDWTQSLVRSASSINDPKLTALLNKMIKDPNSFFELASYVIDHIGTTLQ